MQDTAFGLLAGGAALGLLATHVEQDQGRRLAGAGPARPARRDPHRGRARAPSSPTSSPTSSGRGTTTACTAPSWEYQRDGRYGLVPYEVFGNRTLIFWNGWFPFLFSNQVESKAASAKGNADSSSGGGMKVYSTITFVRGTLDVEKILQRGVHRPQQHLLGGRGRADRDQEPLLHPPRPAPRREGRRVERLAATAWRGTSRATTGCSRTRPDQLGKARTNNGKALDNLIFPQRVKDLIKEIELWRKSKDWYLEKGIPWKRGWLLYGPPGTGKTALARAFAEDLNMPIYVFNLAEMGNHELMKAWTEMQVNVPCIALIEDIDNVFHGRENVVRRPGLFPMMPPRRRRATTTRTSGRGPLGTPLTFDCLLNCLDGVERADGIFTIITTNDITKIDPALGPAAQAAGRHDRVHHHPAGPDRQGGRADLHGAGRQEADGRAHPRASTRASTSRCSEFIDKFPDLQETPAQFQERCGQIALRCFWQEASAEPRGGFFSDLVRLLNERRG